MCAFGGGKEEGEGKEDSVVPERGTTLFHPLELSLGVFLRFRRGTRGRELYGEGRQTNPLPPP